MDTAKVLAIETSTNLLGVALADISGVKCEISIVKPKVHSKMLLPLCMQALEMVGLAFEDIDCLALSIGPGSFTGLRIGAATAQGLAFFEDKPVAKVPTFQIYLKQCSLYPKIGIVQGRSKSQTVCALYDKRLWCGGTHKALAHREFWARNGFRQIIPAGELGYDGFMKYLKTEISAPVWITGDASEQFFHAAADKGMKHVRLVDPYLRLPRPGILSLIGFEMLSTDKASNACSAIPEYYRKSQAEAILSRKL